MNYLPIYIYALSTCTSLSIVHLSIHPYTPPLGSASLKSPHLTGGWHVLTVLVIPACRVEMLPTVMK